MSDDDIDDADTPDARITQPKPLPDGGWSQEIEHLEKALVVPATESAFQQKAGILRADGSYCDTGAFWRNFRPLTVEPEKPEGVVEKLEGRWLWGGVLWVHFGHFLVESTGRLWGLDAMASPPDGIVFISKRPARGDQTEGFQRAFFELCGIDLPIKVLTAPTEVEKLVVPGQGFGLGDIVRGTPQFQTFAQTRIGADVEPEGPEKLYISRSELGLNKGGLIGETQIEEHLAADGYEIFHPQKHDMRTQIARYKAAKHVIAAEGSALHLFGMVGQPHQKVAILVRRQSGATDQIVEHLQSFCGIEVVTVEKLQKIYKKKGGAKKRHDLGVLAMPAVQEDLIRLGFVEASEEAWPKVRWRTVKAAIGDKFEARQRRKDD